MIRPTFVLLVLLALTLTTISWKTASLQNYPTYPP
jgi:hypothetical protein